MQLHRVTTIALAAALALGLVACGGDDDAGTSTTSRTSPPASDPLTLSLSADGTTVTVTLSNTSDGAMTVVPPFVTPHFVAFSVTGPDDEVPFDGEYGRLEPLVESDVVTLAPGESVASDFDLTEHFVLPSGEISVSAEYRAREVHHGGLAMTIDPDDPVTADPIAIEVAP